MLMLLKAITLMVSKFFNCIWHTFTIKDIVLLMDLDFKRANIFNIHLLKFAEIEQKNNCSLIEILLV